MGGSTILDDIFLIQIRFLVVKGCFLQFNSIENQKCVFLIEALCFSLFFWWEKRKKQTKRSYNYTFCHLFRFVKSIHFHCLYRRVNVKRDIIIQRRSERIQNRSIDLSNDNEDGQSTRRSSRLNAVNILSCNEVGDDSQSTSLGDKSDIDGRSGSVWMK